MSWDRCRRRRSRPRGGVAVPKPKINVGQLLRVIGLPTERERAGVLVGQATDLVREVVAVIDGLVTTSIDQRTSVDFMRVREEVFPQYTSAIMALGALTRIVLTRQTIERLSAEAFSEMEADFRDRGESTFGSDLTERGLFTVWTLRKIYDLAKEIEAAELPKNHLEEDAEKARDFVRFALWNRFHVDCLIKALRSGKPIYPEVTEQLRDGLRAAAYAHIRQWADLRNPRPDVDPGPIEWTSEDQQWLNDSMSDLEHAT